MRDTERGPPVKVISKWKAPTTIINNTIICHFAPEIGRLDVSGLLPVILHLFLTLRSSLDTSVGECADV